MIGDRGKTGWGREYRVGLRRLPGLDASKVSRKGGRAAMQGRAEKYAMKHGTAAPTFVGRLVAG